MISFKLYKDTVHPRVFMSEGVSAWTEGRAENDLHLLTAEEAMAVSLAGIHQTLLGIADKLGIELSPSYPLNRTYEDEVRD